VPQIEVTFDIDANGIVHVSAKDLGTGNEQQVTITASSNLSDADIEQAVKDAEKFAEEDKKRKEEVETKGQAEQAVYTIEKSLDEMKDKISDEDKASVQAELDQLKTVMTGDDVQAIKDQIEKTNKVSYDVFGKVYQEEAAKHQAENPGEGGDPGAQGAYDGDTGAGAGGSQSGPVDADYEVK